MSSLGGFSWYGMAVGLVCRCPLRWSRNYLDATGYSEFDVIESSERVEIDSAETESGASGSPESEASMLDVRP